jgi:hypothetical protein
MVPWQAIMQNLLRSSQKRCIKFFLSLKRRYFLCGSVHGHGPFNASLKRSLRKDGMRAGGNSG